MSLIISLLLFAQVERSVEMEVRKGRADLVEQKEAEPASPVVDPGDEETFLSRMLSPMIPWAWLIPLTGVALLVLACLVIAKTTRPAPIATCLVLVPLPVILAILLIAFEHINALSVIRNSTTSPTPIAILNGITELVIQFFYSLAATIPAYLVLAVALLVRVLRFEKRPAN